MAFVPPLASASRPESTWNGVPSDVWSVATEEGAEAEQLSDTVTDGWRKLALPPPQIVEYEGCARWVPFQDH